MTSVFRINWVTYKMISDKFVCILKNDSYSFAIRLRILIR